MKKYLLCIGIVATNAIGAELIQSSCNNWKPSNGKSIEALQSTKLIALQELKSPQKKSEDQDYFNVEQKGRLYFYSLPNEGCKSEVFIIKGDVVEAIDEYPEKSPDFTRVLFFSKTMKKDIVGWVKSDALRRMTYSETRNF